MARKKEGDAFVRVSLVNGSAILLKERRTAQQIAQQLEKHGFVKTMAVQDADEEGTELVLMKAAVLMLAPHVLSMIEKGVVRITSVPSKTRN